MVCMYVRYHLQQSMDQSDMVFNPAINSGELNRKMGFSLSLFAPENLVSREGFGRLVPRQSAHSPHSGCIINHQSSIINLVLTR